MARRRCEWQLDAHGGEGERAGVDVEHVRCDRADRDGQQGEVGERRGQVAGERAGRVAEGGAHAGDRGRGGAGGLQDRAGQEQPKTGPERDRLPAGVGREVAGVVGGVGVPADRVAERRAGREQEPAGPSAVGGGAGAGLGQDDDGRDHEDDREHRERVALEKLDEVVAEERDHHLRHHDDQQAERLRQVRERVQGERAADAVHGEPADARGNRVQPGRERVSPVAEAQPGQHHLRHPVGGATRRQDALGDRADARADHDGQHGLPEAQAERGHRQHADEDGGELQVG